MATRIMITKDVERRLKNLEDRALKLNKDFDRMITRVTDLEESTDRCRDQIDVDKKTVSVIELFMRKNGHCRSLLNHMSLFFLVLLKKVQRVVKNVPTVRDLWARVVDREVSRAVSSITDQLGFTREEQDAMMIIFDVIRDRNLSENQGNDLIEHALRRRHSDEFAPFSSLPGGDTKITGLILYLERQKSVDSTIVSALRRMVAVAYCSVVGNTSQNVTSPRFNKRDLENLNIRVRKIQSETMLACEHDPGEEKQETESGKMDISGVDEIIKDADEKPNERCDVREDKAHDVIDDKVRLITTDSDAINEKQM